MSSIQSILGLLRHHQAMSFREEALKKEAAEWNRAMEISTSTAAEKAKLHDKIVKELKNSVLEAVEKTKKETARADEAERTVQTLCEYLKAASLGMSEAKQTIEGLEGDKSTLQKKKDDLQSKVDLLESELKMLKDLQAKAIEDAKEEATDDAWYRMWSTNPETLDLDFMGEELEPALVRWNARLELEQLEETTVMDVEGDDEDDNNVISSVLKTGSSRLEEITKETREVFQADDNTPAPPEVAPAVETTGTTPKELEINPPTDANQS